ncbi:MAG: hypothetical protein AB8I08_35380 [Sandaracinaceae bacterium]
MPTLRSAPSFVFSLAALVLGGCLGQSGGPPACLAPVHCVCATDFSHFIRGTVIEDSGPQATLDGPGRNGRRAVQVRIDELPFPDAYPLLSTGMVLEGTLNWDSCRTQPDYTVGTEVLVFNYQTAGDAVEEGYLTIGLDEGDAYNLGEESTGSGRVNLSDIPTLGGRAECEVRFPEPEAPFCSDTI